MFSLGSKQPYIFCCADLWNISETIYGLSSNTGFITKVHVFCVEKWNLWVHSLTWENSLLIQATEVLFHLCIEWWIYEFVLWAVFFFSCFFFLFFLIIFSVERPWLHSMWKLCWILRQRYHRSWAVQRHLHGIRGYFLLPVKQFLLFLTHSHYSNYC